MKIRVVLLALVVTISFAGFSLAIDKNTIVGLWLFDEGKGVVVKDISNNGHDAEILGDAEWVEGNFGGAISLPGKSGNYVSIPHDDSLTLETFSMTAWISYGLTGTTQRIVIKGSATSNYSYYLSTRGGDVLSYTGFSTSGQGGWVETFGKTPVADNNWHHVAATYDKKSLRLYVDGKLESEIANSAKPFVVDDPLAIGAESDGNYSAVGSIDDVGVFNAGLSEDDIKDIMSKGLGEATGMLSVYPAGKLTTVWGKMKAKTSL